MSWGWTGVRRRKERTAHAATRAQSLLREMEGNAQARPGSQSSPCRIGSRVRVVVGTGSQNNESDVMSRQGIVTVTKVSRNDNVTVMPMSHNDHVTVTQGPRDYDANAAQQSRQRHVTVTQRSRDCHANVT